MSFLDFKKFKNILTFILQIKYLKEIKKQFLKAIYIYYKKIKP